MKDFELGYTAQQQYQLKLAQRQGLDTTLLENNALTYSQMEVLRNAMQEGIDISSFCFPQMPLDEMKRQVALAEEKQHIVDIAKEEYHQSKLKTIMLVLGILFVIIASGYLIYSNRAFLSAYFNAPEIVLKEDKVDHKLSKPFNCMDYLDSFDKEYELTVKGNDKLISVGEHKISYCQSNGVRETCKYLYVNAIDDISPKIKLSKSKATIDENSDFVPSSYILEATDNIDGDLTKNVTWSKFDPSKDTQEITFQVSDNAGNTAKEVLIVTVKKQAPVIVQEPTSTQDNEGNDQSSDNISSAPPSSSTSESGGFYHIDNYASFDEAMNACLAEINGRSGMCVPIAENDIYIGYQAIYN